MEKMIVWVALRTDQLETWFTNTTQGSLYGVYLTEDRAKAGIAERLHIDITWQQCGQNGNGSVYNAEYIYTSSTGKIIPIYLMLIPVVIQ